MHKKLVTFLELFHGILLLFPFVPLVAFLATRFDTNLVFETCFPFAFFLYIPLVVSFFSSQYFRSIFPFLGVSIASVAVFFFLPIGVCLRVFLCVFAAIIFIIRVAGRIRDDDILSSPSSFFLILFALMYILGVSVEIPYLATFSYYGAFAYILMLCLYWNETRLEDYLSLSDNVASIPRKQIVRTNTGAMILLIVIAIVFLILFPLLGLDKLLKQTGLLLLAGIRLLIQFLDNKTEYFDEPTPSHNPTLDVLNSLGIDTETNPVLAALQNYVFAFFQVLMILLVIYVVIRIVMYIVTAFYQPYDDLADKQEFISTETDKKESLFQSVLKERLQNIDFSVTGSIRRIYKKKILQGLKTVKKQKANALGKAILDSGSLYQAMTPAELEKEANLPLEDEQHPFHQLYEKARYSGEALSKDDLEKMKSIKM